MNDFNLLITSVGRRVSLVRLFREALHKLNIKGLVHAVDFQNHAPGLLAADKFQTVHRVTDINYIDKLLEICLTNNIKLVIPTIDTELLILSREKDKFLSHGIQILVCSQSVNKIFFDKRNTHLFFNNNGIPSPNLYNSSEAQELPQSSFPLLLKPNNGSSSIGVTKVLNHKELLFFFDYLEDPIIQDFIDGKEYTVDVLLDLNGNVKCIVPRLRVETRAGEVSKSITVRDFEIIDWASKIAVLLKGAIGCITIQCIKQKNGAIKFIEINPRFGGGFPLTAQAGADFPRWILQMIVGLNLDADIQELWSDGCLMLRYDEAFFKNAKDFKL